MMIFRLCFVLLFSFHPSVVFASNWHVSQTMDQLTDKKTTTAMTSNKYQSLVVRCKDDFLNVYVIYRDYLNNSNVPVTFRIDNNSPETDYWTVSADGTAVFATYPSFIARKLMNNNRFIIEAKDFRGVPHRVIFKLSGSMKSISKVFTQCRLPIFSPEKRFPMLRHEIAEEIEKRWNRGLVQASKQLLKSLGKYSGQINKSLDTDFVISLQHFYDSDHFISGCKKINWDSEDCKRASVKGLIYDYLEDSDIKYNRQASKNW